LIDEKPLSLDAEIACRMAKAQATDVLSFAGDRSVQFHGGIGFTWDCDSTLFIRRAQWTRQAFGDAGHHRKYLGTLLLGS
jgi:alkylation response protein AidB-like acyl-CoA dehydrogenase